MTEFEFLLDDYRLTTAEILYQLPDYPSLLQTFVWQDYDLPPTFPKLQDFLKFWSHSIEGKIKSVQVVSAGNLEKNKIIIPTFSAMVH